MTRRSDGRISARGVFERWLSASIIASARQKESDSADPVEAQKYRDSRANKKRCSHREGVRRGVDRAIGVASTVWERHSDYCRNQKTSHTDNHSNDDWPFHFPP
jgi:hypothetical protein